MRFFSFIACCSFFSISGFSASVTCLTNNSGQCASVASTIAITTAGSNLTISNTANFSSAIDIIYFDPTPNNVITGINIGAHTGTVAFQLGGNPANLPAGNTATPVFDSLFRISSTSNANRIDGGESLTVSATGGNLADLFNSGAVRLGFHVQSVGTGGQSESLVAVGTASAVPEPSTLSLGAAGLALVAMIRRRRISQAH